MIGFDITFSSLLPGINVTNEKKMYFQKNIFELKYNEVENAIQTEPILFFNSDFQLEELQYQRKKLKYGTLLYYYLDKKDQRQSDFLVYYANGILFMSANYLNNKLEGKCTTYFQNGAIKSVSYYKDGKITGDYYGYSIYGNLLIYEQFKDLQLNGLSKRWCINGCCCIHLMYENNIIKHIDEYMSNKEVKSYDLTEEESKIFDSINRINNNGTIYFYDVIDNDLLDLKCNQLISLHNNFMNNDIKNITDNNITISNPKKKRKQN